MALQDLTPQLRTRLSFVEKAVGWFVMLAALLLLFGFGYYLYTAAERKGWLKIKVPFYMYADRATGLNIGDPVKLMGFNVGEITHITATKWGDPENVYVQFEITQPYYDYLLTGDSRAQLTSADFLGKRSLEVTKGTNGQPAYLFHPFQEHLALEQAKTLLELGKWRLAEDIGDPAATNSPAKFKTKQPLSRELLRSLESLGVREIRAYDTGSKGKSITAVWNDQAGFYETYGLTNIYHLVSDETPALTERAEKIVAQIEAALPNFLRLTNEISGLLSNATRLTVNLDHTADQVHPILTNLAIISGHLTNGHGSLGEWAIPTNLNAQLELTLAHANLTMTNANTNLAAIAEGLTLNLEHLASITSNLNNQVEANTNLLTRISDIIVHSDQFIQGLKRHWLLRSAFRTPATNAPPSAVKPSPPSPARSPRGKEQDR